MASFRDLEFTPQEIARLTGLPKTRIDELEKQGHIQSIRRKVGNVDRKMVPLENLQAFLRTELVRHGERFPEHKIQMFYNVKGGTGKSTLTAQYAMQAAMMGLKVLALDLDGQGHLSVNLDVLDSHERPTIYDVIINDLQLERAIMNVAPGLDLVPANLGLCTIEIPLNQKPRREYRLGEAIASIADRYDLIVADTNPAASILNSSMLVAADLVNVVCATNPLSFHGMSLVMATIEDMEREFRRQLQVKIIPNMYDNREVISQEVLGELKSQFGEFCSNAVVSRSADLNEATKRRSTVWEVNSRGTASNDIMTMARELVGWTGFIDVKTEPPKEEPKVLSPQPIPETSPETSSSMIAEI